MPASRPPARATRTPRAAAAALPYTPTVTIAIPTLNEALHIEGLIRRFLATRYPRLVEVCVADGGSTDGTREIVERLSQEDPRVKLIDNPQRIQAAGLNRILAVAEGDVFLRADAHCEYADDYVEVCLATLLETGALNVGGAQRFVARSLFQAAVALASRSLFGSGGARYRDPTFDGYADTVFMGCFWRRDLRAVAGYRVMATAEDAELNMRLIQRARRLGFGSEPEALYTTSRIKVWYYPRPSWKALFKQYYRYGLGRYRAVREHPGEAPLRGKLPFLVLSAALCLFLFDQAALGGALHTLALGLAAAGTLLLAGLWTALRLRHSFAEEMWRGAREARPSLLARGLLCGVVFMTEPVAHWAGFATALIADLLDRASGSLRGPWQPLPTRSPGELMRFVAPKASAS